MNAIDRHLAYVVLNDHILFDDFEKSRMTLQRFVQKHKARIARVEAASFDKPATWKVRT